MFDDSLLRENPVLVTGASGYVAGWIIAELLRRGCTVHACVRNPDDTEKTRYLSAIADESDGCLKFFKTDLLIPGSYQEAMQGCVIVFHTASPFILNVEDPQRDLVDPAVQGTENVLHSVNQCDSVQRVVLTSSVAAIYSDNIECQEKPMKTLLESDWNSYSNLAHNPYSYSKTAAEKAAWSLVEQQQRWTLVAINPSLVVGPALNPRATSDSFGLMKQFADGTLKYGAPDSGIGMVAVQDVATAHIHAAINPAANGRYITNAINSSLMYISEVLRPDYAQHYPLPKSTTPKWIAWLCAPLFGVSRDFIKRNLNHNFSADNSKSVAELGMQYSAVDEAIKAMFAQMHEHQLLD